MRKASSGFILLAVFLLAQQPGLAQLHKFRPGINLFTPEQDIELGKEAASEIGKQVEIVNNKELTDYITSIGKRLAAQPQAGQYPYTFQVVNDPSINAFALPGGPTFVHTGLILAVDNEAQLAGVLAHEIVHVALRHGTNQASKANLIQLPVLLAGSTLGSGSLLAQLGQIGIGIGANSVLLKFSRTAETQADLMGAQIAAQAGYNPIEMARFFEKLEKEGGARGPQFFSDHPNPGNRMQAITDEIQYLPQKTYNFDTGQLARMKAIAQKLPPPKKAVAQAAQTTPLSIPDSRPSKSLQQYSGSGFRLSYPENWKPISGPDEAGVMIAPGAGVLQSQSGVNVGYGIVLDYYRPNNRNAGLREATEEFVSRLKSAHPGMRTAAGLRDTRVGGKKAVITTLYSESVFQGETEVDRLLTVSHPNGILYVVFVSPQSETQYANKVFDRIIRSMRFSF
jgi:hypothetical protein